MFGDSSTALVMSPHGGRGCRLHSNGTRVFNGQPFYRKGDVSVFCVMGGTMQRPGKLGVRVEIDWGSRKEDHRARLERLNWKLTSFWFIYFLPPQAVYGSLHRFHWVTDTSCLQGYAFLLLTFHLPLNNLETPAMCLSQFSFEYLFVNFRPKTHWLEDFP